MRIYAYEIAQPSSGHHGCDKGISVLVAASSHGYRRSERKQYRFYTLRGKDNTPTSSCPLFMKSIIEMTKGGSRSPTNLERFTMCYSKLLVPVTLYSIFELLQ